MINFCRRTACRMQGTFLRFPIMLSLVLTVGLSNSVFAQNWRSHTSLRQVVDITATEDATWAATTGGVFRYGVESGEISLGDTLEILG